MTKATTQEPEGLPEPQQTPADDPSGDHAGHWCPECGNRTRFIGYDAEGQPGREACECDHDPCICWTWLRQEFTCDPATGEVIEYHSHTGGGSGAEIGEYTTIICAECEMTTHFVPPEGFRDELRRMLSVPQLAELASYGADAGWPGLTYTADCVDLYQRHEAEIWEALVDDAEAHGHPNVCAFVATFRRSDMISDPDLFRTLLVWYMAEREARHLVEY